MIVAKYPNHQYIHQCSHMCWPSYLPGQLSEEVLICSKGPQAVKVADGGGQWLQFITATVQLLQKRQTGGGRRRRREEMMKK